MRKTRLLIIADDCTGALDTGVQFAKIGIEVEVVTDMAKLPDAAGKGTEVLVAAAMTRHMLPDEAYDTVFQIVLQARRAGIGHIYKKTDSALRGNIGAELAALLDAGGADMLPFLPAYPDMNRITVDGCHYIDGVPVAKSAFGHDPMNPVTTSYVPKLIAAQTKVPVWKAGCGRISHRAGVAVIDAKTDSDLKAAGEKLKMIGALTISAGCAGFAAFLPDLLELKREAPPQMPELRDGLCVICGSVHPATKKQLDHAERNGFTRIHLRQEAINGSNQQETFISDRPADSGSDQSADSGSDQSADSGSDRPAAFGSWQSGSSIRIDRWMIIDTLSSEDKTLSVRPVMGQLASLCGEIFRSSQGTILITGGDTLALCLQHMHVQRITPMLELYPGVVLSVIQTPEREQYVISKSGGFGEETLLTDLRELIKANVT